MVHNIQLMIFDIAGTTVKDNGEITKAFKDAMRQFGYDIPAEKIYLLMGYKKPDAIRMMLNENEPDISKITPMLIEKIHAQFKSLMIQYYQNTEDLQPLPNAEKIFEHFHKQDVKIGLDTGFSHEITEVIMEKLGWLKDGKVDYVVSSDEVIAGRPTPYMIQNMMKKACITNPKSVVKTGDTEVDVQEGKNAECLYSIAVTSGAFTRQELIPYKPDFIIDDLIELMHII